MGTVTSAMKVAGKATKSIAGWLSGGAGASGLLKNSLVAYGGWSVLTGKGLVNGAVDLLGGEVKEAHEKDGIVGAAEVVLFGKDGNEKSLVGNVVDEVVGKGSYQKAEAAVKSAYASTSDYVREQYNSAVGSQLPMQSTMQPDMYSQMPLSGFSNPFTSVNQFVGNITGGKMSTGNLVSIIAAAYMMFGSRFGWMGKIASMLLGGMTVKDMQNRQAIQQQAQLGFSPVPSGYAVMPQSPQVPQQDIQDNNHTVSRLRL